MLRPKAVSAYLLEQWTVAGDLLSRIEKLRDETGEITDIKQELYKYAMECK
jgi:hypothetical protein